MHKQVNAASLQNGTVLDFGGSTGTVVDYEQHPDTNEVRFSLATDRVETRLDKTLKPYPKVVTETYGPFRFHRNVTFTIVKGT